MKSLQTRFKRQHETNYYELFLKTDPWLYIIFNSDLNETTLQAGAQWIILDGDLRKSIEEAASDSVEEVFEFFLLRSPHMLAGSKDVFRDPKGTLYRVLDRIRGNHGLQVPEPVNPLACFNDQKLTEECRRRGISV